MPCYLQCSAVEYSSAQSIPELPYTVQEAGWGVLTTVSWGQTTVREGLEGGKMMLTLLGMITSGQCEQYSDNSTFNTPYTVMDTGSGQTEKPLTYGGQTRYRRTAGPV